VVQLSRSILMNLSTPGKVARCVSEYLFRPKAQTDIEGIWNYTCQTWGISQTRHYVKGLRDVCAYLAKNPHVGKTRDDLYAGLHVYPSAKHLIFYLVVEKGIDAVRILHERMDSKLHLS